MSSLVLSCSLTKAATETITIKNSTDTSLRYQVFRNGEKGQCPFYWEFQKAVIKPKSTTVISYDNEKLRLYNGRYTGKTLTTDNSYKPVCINKTLKTITIRAKTMNIALIAKHAVLYFVPIKAILLKIKLNGPLIQTANILWNKQINCRIERINSVLIHQIIYFDTIAFTKRDIFYEKATTSTG